MITRLSGNYLNTIPREFSHIGRRWLVEAITTDDRDDLITLEASTPRYGNDRDFVLNNYSTIEKVIFNEPATIILWSDNTKSVVKCQNGEPFDAEKGFALAYLKKLLGNDNTFNKEIRKWVIDNVG